MRESVSSTYVHVCRCSIDCNVQAATFKMISCILVSCQHTVKLKATAPTLYYTYVKATTPPLHTCMYVLKPLHPHNNTIVIHMAPVKGLMNHWSEAALIWTGSK